MKKMKNADMSCSAGLPTSQPPSSPRLANPASGANVARRSFLYTCSIATSATIAAAIITISLCMYVRRGRSRQPSDEERSSFCCPREVEKMFRYVNASLDPCQDFFAYVCSNGDKLRHSADSDLEVELERVVITRAMPNGRPMGEAGHFLNAYYKTCVQTVSQPRLFTATLAKALITEAGDLLDDMNSRNVLIFSMTASIKYFLHSVIRIDFEPGDTRIAFQVTPICDISAFLDVLGSVIDALNANNINLTIRELADFAEMLCERFEKDGIGKAYYRTIDETDVFNREVWNIEDLDAGFRAHGMVLQNVDFIVVYTVHQMRLFYEMLPEENSKKKAAYLLWHTVARAVLQFSSSSSQSWPRVFETCSKSLSVMLDIWNRFRSGILTNRDQDTEANAIFVALKDSMEKEWQEAFLFAPANASEIKTFFANAELLTPVATKINPIPIPRATKDFAQNLLRGRAYDFDVSLEHLSTLNAKTALHYRHMAIVEGRYFVLHATSYSLIRADSPSSRLPNMALLGQLLAETFWVAALNIIECDPETMDNILSLKACFAQHYMPNEPYDYEAEMVLVRALGLSSVLSALNLPDWYDVKIACSVTRLSHAQFFHMYSTYNSCPKNRSSQLAIKINAALMYVADFTKAFGCSLDAPLSRRVDRTTHRETQTKLAHPHRATNTRRRNTEDLGRQHTDWAGFQKRTQPFLPSTLR